MLKDIFLYGAVLSYLLYTRETFSCFFPLKNLNTSLFLPDLLEPSYLSLPIFPLFLYRRESFLVRSINTELFYLFFSGDSQRFKFGQLVD